MSFDGENAFRYLQKMAVEVGTRPSGSALEKKTTDWVLGEFKKMGLNAWIEEFEVTTGRVLSQKLEVLKPYTADMGCEVMPLSGSTGAEGVTGDLLYLDNYDEEYVTEEVEGKIILTGGQPVDRDKSLRLLMKHKPLALIFIESTPKAMAKNLWGSPLSKKKHGNLPTARVTFEDGLKLIQSGAKLLHLVADTEDEIVKSWNVVAELKGSVFPYEIIVVGGHYDTVLEVSGAGDNAGGTAIVMELARIFEKKGSKRTIRFAAWGSEELGLLGSRSYATKLREVSEAAKKENENAVTELDNTLLCINLDVHGGLIGTNSSNVLGPPELTAAVKVLSKELGSGIKVSESVGSTDSTSLSAVGIPSVSLSRMTPTNSLMHSREDTIQWLAPSALQVHGAFLDEFLTRYVAKAVAFPFERTIPEKQKKDIEDYFKKGGRKLP
jgi:aminopeptidase YwaD